MSNYKVISSPPYFEMLPKYSSASEEVQFALNTKPFSTDFACILLVATKTDIREHSSLPHFLVLGKHMALLKQRVGPENLQGPCQPQPGCDSGNLGVQNS